MLLERELDSEVGEVLLVYKPKGWTSFDVVNKLRHVLRIRKIGHAGTLDPMASGLLIVCTGKKTKEIREYTGLEKEYRGRMMLGARTESFDAETPVTEEHGTQGITGEKIRAAMERFTGYQTQLPPMWSAVKVGGKRLYKYARKGITIQRKPREVLVQSFLATHIEIPEVSFTVVCSKGTYVRTLIDDMGRYLGCGAYLTALERTRIGPYSVSDAMTIEELQRVSAPTRQAR